MPMSWTAENDRILLFKLIETHNITVQAQKIADAWPEDAPVKPTGRAIKERFVRLGQLSGLKGVTVSTPSKSRAKAGNFNGGTTPSSSAKKRKVQGKESSESDADGHETPDEMKTPTRHRAAMTKKLANIPTTPTTPRIKREPLETLSSSPKFAQDSYRARELSQNMGSFGEGPIDYNYGVPTPGGSRTNSFAEIENTFTFDNAFGPVGGSFGSGQSSMVDNTNGFGFSGDMGMSGFDGMTERIHSRSMMGMPAPNIFAHDTARLSIEQQMKQTPRTPFRNIAALPSAKPSESPVRRPVSTRHASQAATKGMSAWARQQREEDEEDGEKTSEEDSQPSDDFQEDSDIEYV